MREDVATSEVGWMGSAKLFDLRNLGQALSPVEVFPGNQREHLLEFGQSGLPRVHQGVAAAGSRLIPA